MLKPQAKLGLKPLGYTRMNNTPARFRYLSEADYSSLKVHVEQLLNRAYLNLHGSKMPTTPTDWYDNIFAAALELAMDPSIRGHNDKQIMHLFEDIIAISQELHAQAQDALTKASNPVYLRMVALDSHLRARQERQDSIPNRPAKQVATIGANIAGRLPQTPMEDDLSEFSFAS